MSRFALSDEFDPDDDGDSLMPVDVFMRLNDEAQFQVCIPNAWLRTREAIQAPEPMTAERAARLSRGRGC
jgi:hypothetical protein